MITRRPPQWVRGLTASGLGLFLLAPQLAAQIPARLGITQEGDQLVLSWNAVPGGQYQLYSSPSTEEAWVEVETSPKPLVAAGATVSYHLEIPAETRFFRVAQLGDFEAARLAWIPPGTFTMGSPVAERGRDADESPQTVVTLTRGFWMGKYEVTQEEYQEVMGSNPSYRLGDPQRPVEQVTWHDSVEYCARLTQRERAAGRISETSAYRLPTEAEWEHACRAGTTTRFHYGDDDSAYSGLTAYAWYDLNSELTTHPVGLKLPNPWGLYDMMGNVYEWCQDWYAEYAGGSVTDPQGSETGVERVMRGSSYYRDARLCRSANRHKFNPDGRYFHWGFRVVLDLDRP